MSLSGWVFGDSYALIRCEKCGEGFCAEFAFWARCVAGSTTLSGGEGRKREGS